MRTASLMVEVCRDCARTWGVTMTPREDVLCSDCARSRPWRRPVTYWQARIWNFPHSYPYTRSLEWWDQQTSLQDLRIAVSLAAQLEEDSHA